MSYINPLCLPILLISVDAANKKINLEKDIIEINKNNYDIGLIFAIDFAPGQSIKFRSICLYSKFNQDIVKGYVETDFEKMVNLGKEFQPRLMTYYRGGKDFNFNVELGYPELNK